MQNGLHQASSFRLSLCDGWSFQPDDLHQHCWPQCVWRCLSLRDCMVVSHNGVDDTCELAMQRCDRLETHPDFSINVYGKARSKCAHWVSNTLYDEQKAVVFLQGSDDAFKIAGGRLALNNDVYPGKHVRFRDEGIYVAVSTTQVTSSLSGQVLHLSPTCQPAWIPYFPPNSSPVSRALGLISLRIVSSKCHELIIVENELSRKLAHEISISQRCS